MFDRRAVLVALTSCWLAIADTAPAHADALDPPMPALKKGTDGRGFASISLPEASIAKEWSDGEGGGLGAWTLELDTSNKDPEGFVYLLQRTGFARAELAGSMGHGCRWGVREPDSIQVKVGEWRERFADAKTGMVYSSRVVAARGQVFVAVVQMKSVLLDVWGAHVQQILDGLEPLAAPASLDLPAKFVKSVTKTAEVWTDGKKGDVDRVVREWGNAVALWPKVFPGDPVFPHAPRIILCNDDAGYEALATSSKGAAPPMCIYSSAHRAVIVRLSKRKEDEFIQALHRAAGEQMCEYHFGGRAPVWIEEGLRMYLGVGAQRSGHFEQTIGELVEKARASAATRQVAFSDVLAMTDIPREGRSGIDRELYAWHFYFRHGPGAKSMGDRYRTCLETLRRTGDARQVAAAWDGVDHAKLKADFMAWLQRWREGKSD